MKNSVCVRTLSGIPLQDLKNKRVLIRADFNVPIGDNGVVDNYEDWRIKAAVPTIKYLLKRGSKIILLSHLGRPEGKIVEKLRLGPIQDKLSELLGISVARTPDCVGEIVKKAVIEIKQGEVLMLENLRFHEEEEKNDEKFAKELATFGDLYINDAFSDSHRKHASIDAITKYSPSYAGLLMEKEINMMESATNPVHLAIAIIGGAKIETKLPVVENLAKIYDYVLVGGKIANEIIRADLSSSISSNVILPVKKDLIKEQYFDIGRGTVREFSKFFQKAKTIVWNGPMGMFEEVKYQEGTKGVVELVELAHKKGANILIGGGETINAMQKFASELMRGNIKGFNVSTGGGAMLEYLAGKKLPGIEVLKK